MFLVINRAKCDSVILLASNISQNFSPLVLFQVYRRVVWSESLVSGASRGLGAAGVQFRSTVPEPHPNTVCSSTTSVLLRDCKTLLCTGFFFTLPHGILMCCGYVSLDVVGCSKNHWWSHFVSRKIYVKLLYATCWPKVGLCNLESDPNCFAEQGVVSQPRTCVTNTVGDSPLFSAEI